MQLLCYSGCLIALIGLSALSLPRDGLTAPASFASTLMQPIKKRQIMTIKSLLIPHFDKVTT